MIISLTLVMMGGGAICAPQSVFIFLPKISPPIFICENNRKSDKIMHCVDFFLRGGCEDRDISWAFFTNLSIETIYLSPELREKWPYLQNDHSRFFFSTQCIILLPFLLFSQIKIGVTL